MKRNNHRKPRVVRKTFLLTMIFSMIVLICIPLVAVQLWLVNQSTNEIKANHTAAFIAALQSNSRSYNSQLDMLDYNALKISADKKVSKPLDSKANGYDLFQAAQVVKGYSIGLPSVEEIGFYYPSRDSVLLGGYQPSKELFFSTVGAVEEKSQQELMYFLRTLEKMDVFFVRNSDSYGKFLVARPVYLESKTAFDGVVIYILDADELCRTFQANTLSGSNIAVANMNGEWVLFNSEFPVKACQNDTFQSFLRDSERVFLELTASQMRLEIYKYTDDVTGNVYLASVVQEASQKQLTAYVDRVMTFMVLSLLLVIVLFAITVYINYRPVKKLVQRHSAVAGETNLSELELLDAAFFARDEKISGQRSLLAGFVLGDLIYGAAVDSELLDKQFNRDNLRYFTVLTVSAAELTASQANVVVEDLRKNLDNTEVYTTSMPNRPHVLFILLAQDPIDTVMVKAEMHLSLRETIGCDGDVRVGEVVQNLEDIRKSYYSSFVEPVTELESDDLIAAGDYPVKEIQYFMQQVCVGDKARALKSLEKIEVVLATRKLRPAYRQYYCYKLLTTFLTGTKDNQITVPEEEMDALMAFRNPSRLFALLRDTVSNYCDMVASAVAISNARTQRELLAYVDENLTNCELCLISAADHMNISTYAVSRLFKEGTGIGFKEYVTSKRLELAYKMLRTTKDSVGDIAKAVGFESAAYFSTAFKKYYTVSPTQVRNGEEAPREDIQ